VSTLQAVNDQLGSGNPEVLRETLMRAAHLGVYGAVPASPVGTDQGAVDQLTTQAAAVLKVVGSRLAAISALETSADQVAYDTQRLQLVFGPGFLALPRFSPANAAELVTALGASNAVQGNDPTASVTWVHRQALVRPAVARLESALTFAEAIGASDGLAFQVAQLPFAADTLWSALPANPRASAGSVGLVVHSPGPLDPTKPLGGLFVDEVVEVVPSASETTGIAFHHDEPNARAAQALLLAVPPTADPWTVDTLAATVRETLDLAHIRMVDPDVLRQAGQLTPALYLAVNLAQETVSSDLSGLDITPDPLPLRLLHITVMPSPLVQARTAQVTVYAQDATWGGAIVDGKVTIPGLPDYRTNTVFPLTVGAAAPGGTVTAPGFATTPIPWPPLVPATMTVTVTPSPLVQGRTAQVIVHAQDATWGGAIVDGKVTIPGLPDYRTNTVFPLTVGAAAPGGTVTAPGFATAPIPWPPLVPATMTVTVTPNDPSMNRPIQLLVTAVDSQTRAAVPGAMVTLTNYVLGSPNTTTIQFPAGTPHTVTLRSWTFARTGVTQYPSATVQAPLYQNGQVPFAFS
jgi:hypothetical protein